MQKIYRFTGDIFLNWRYSEFTTDTDHSTNRLYMSAYSRSVHQHIIFELLDENRNALQISIGDGIKSLMHILSLETVEVVLGSKQCLKSFPECFNPIRTYSYRL